MEHEHGIQLVDLMCKVLRNILPLTLTFNVGSCWPIGHLLGEVQISMGQAALIDFNFVVVNPMNATKKINVGVRRS
jgi:hypothetical protein